jgi:4'-phosphopantetheinyl transferase
MKCRRIADSSFELAGRSVYVWPVHNVAPIAVAAEFDRLLSPDERDRAAGFRSDHLRHSFVLARGSLRILLGRYLSVSPASIRFTYSSRGKPALSAPACLDFNASHSGGLAVFAFTTGLEIGVDVEQVRSLPDIEDIARRFFCFEETEEIMSLPEKQRNRAFFRCWTRKEAYIKAIGDGLSAPLNGFRVTVQPNQPARFLHLAQDENAATNWTLCDLQLAPGYAAALAYGDLKRPVVIFPLTDAAELLTIL